MTTKAIRVVVTGAAGQIGYALLFRIAAGEMFGPDMAIHLNLLEIEPALPALKGVVMELEDCAFPLLKSVTPTTDLKVAFKDVDWALLVGSIPRKAGMERSDLLKINGKIFIDQGRAISDCANPSCKILVVGNPCNANAAIAQSAAKNIAPENFFALTMLDQNRAVAQLAKKAGVDITEVKNLAIWGNHSTTQFPDFYHASIQGKSLLEVIKEEEWLKTIFIETVQKRGAEVIKARGLSSAGSAANAVIDTVKKLTTPTPAGDFFSVAVSSGGQHGVSKGLIFSYPVRSDGRTWTVVDGLRHNTFAQEKINLTEQELLAEREAIKSFLTS